MKLEQFQTGYTVDREVFQATYWCNSNTSEGPELIGPLNDIIRSTEHGQGTAGRIHQDSVDCPLSYYFTILLIWILWFPGLDVVIPLKSTKSLSFKVLNRMLQTWYDHHFKILTYQHWKRDDVMDSESKRPLQIQWAWNMEEWWTRPSEFRPGSVTLYRGTTYLPSIERDVMYRSIWPGAQRFGYDSGSLRLEPGPDWL